ncbi:ribonuclease M5 [Bacillus sp. FJAT-45350]|uniref:ribonuclease M5 n=1 Tax=Bacillus sp. FJAT-45350 TaxID=2011014 RepID=UPI000BB8BD31|nr:ribonuclease M5 [Bacillus sp. FJAT-45350]
MKIKEVIVVEGRDDTVAIQRAVQADTIETNGSSIGEKVLVQVELAQERRGVIIFTDPDYPGERIRRIVSERVPGCKHAFIPKRDAISKNGDDLGVENASPEAIRQALHNAKQEIMDDIEEEISWQDLIDAGLIGGTMAKARRDRLGLLLKVGYCNGKQLYKRLLKFQVTKDEFAASFAQVLEEEQND